MFPALDKAIEDIRAVRDCPAVQRLCLDCWGIAVTHGEAEAVRFAAMLHKGVTAYQRREDELRTIGLPSRSEVRHGNASAQSAEGEDRQR